MKYCTRLSDIPNTPHWAVLESNSITIPGDQRSRDCPGHGYPESTNWYLTYIAFDSKQELEQWVQRNAFNQYNPKRPDRDYRVIFSDPRTPEIKAQVTL